MTDMNWWYLSFVNKDLPAGSRFVGACIVRGSDPITACEEAWRLRVNPGGEVLCKEITPDLLQPPLEWVERLLTAADVEEFDRQQLARMRP